MMQFLVSLCACLMGPCPALLSPPYPVFIPPVSMSLVLFSYPFIFPSLCIAEYIKMLYNVTLAFDHCQLTRGVCLQAGSRNDQCDDARGCSCALESIGIKIFKMSSMLSCRSIKSMSGQHL